MSKYTPSYRDRGDRYRCLHYDKEAEPCWGEVFGSSRGMECAGHRGGTFRQEPTPDEIAAEFAAQRQAIIEAKARKAEEERQRRDEAEARRWFRPLIDRAAEVTPLGWWQALSNEMLCAVFSFLGEGIESEWDRKGGPAQRALQDAGLPAIAEVQRRGLDWPVGAYELRLTPENALAPWRSTDRYAVFGPEVMAFDPSHLSDLELRLWHGCAGHVADYSCLDRGVRQIVLFLFTVTRNELEKRGIRPECLFDLDEEHVT